MIPYTYPYSVLNISYWVMLTMVLWSCHSPAIQNKEEISLEYWDTHLFVADRDSAGNNIGLDAVYFVFTVNNQSDQNYYLELDTWLWPKKDSISCSASLACQDAGDSCRLQLAYITKPILWLAEGQVDTVVLKTDFRALNPFFRDCLGTIDSNKIREAVRSIHFHYEAKQEKMKINRGKVYQPVNYWSKKLVRVPD